MPKQKTFRFFYHITGSGVIDIEAINQEQADDLFNDKADSELLEELYSIDSECDESEEIK